MFIETVIGNIAPKGALVSVGKILDIFPKSRQVKILVNGVIFRRQEVLFFEPSYLQQVLSIFRRRVKVEVALLTEVVCIPIDAFSLNRLQAGDPVYKFVPEGSPGRRWSSYPCGH